MACFSGVLSLITQSGHVNGNPLGLIPTILTTIFRRLQVLGCKVLDHVVRLGAMLGLCGTYVGPMLSHFRVMLGHLGLCWRLSNSNLKKTEFYNISFFLGFLAPAETNRKFTTQDLYC